MGARLGSGVEVGGVWFNEEYLIMREKIDNRNRDVGGIGKRIGMRENYENCVIGENPNLLL